MDTYRLQNVCPPLALAALAPAGSGRSPVHQETAMTGPDVGDVAPDFTLRRGVDQPVRLRELLERGPVLLCFYVFDFGEY